MIHAAIIAGLSACFLVTPALALDCAGTLDPSAEAICADPKALAADVRMSSAYEALLSVKDAPPHAALLADQRDWLNRRNLTCLGDAPTARACFTAFDEARARDLRGEPEAGPGAGGRLVPAIRREPATTTKMAWQARLFRFPDPSTPAERAFNDRVGARLANVPADASVDPGQKGTWSQSGTIAYASPDLLSVRVDGSEFVEGAAHGMTWTENLNFDMRKGRLVKAAAFLTPGGANALKQLCATQVTKALEADEGTSGGHAADPGAARQVGAGNQDTRADLDKVTLDSSHWQFGAVGLTVTVSDVPSPRFGRLSYRARP